MNRMNLIILLDRLDQMIDSAPEIPLTGKCIVDAEQALDLLDRIRNAIPEEVKRAEWLTAEKERVIGDSQAEADRMLMEAERYVARMVSENEITNKAKALSEQLVAEAKQEAQRITAEADQYAASVLESLEGALQRTMDVVRRGRAELNAAHTTAETPRS